MPSPKSGTHPKGRPVSKGGHEKSVPVRLKLSAIGMESEFSLVVDEKPVRPEDLFRDPRDFIRGPLMHRTGTSYHLPTGGAIYFDTGVIEIATPVIELEPGCAARAGRSLWESILFVREELDVWERQTGHNARLVGFSAHYNVSFDLSLYEQGASRTLDKLAWLLAFILPVPVMLLATNRRSTGVGIRPRSNRVEITADFTPSASLMIVTGALITGIVRKVMSWPSFEIEMLDRAGIPVIKGYSPTKHTSRQGWLARYDRYPQNPFTCNVDDPLWNVYDVFFKRHNQDPHPLSLREIAKSIFFKFEQSIREIAGPFTFPMIESVLSGSAPSLLELPDRPTEYEDVGRLCVWDNLFPERLVSRSRYERVLIRAISGHNLRLKGEVYTPTGMSGWSEVLFRRESDGTYHIFTIDDLVTHLDRWERR